MAEISRTRIALLALSFAVALAVGFVLWQRPGQTRSTRHWTALPYNRTNDPGGFVAVNAARDPLHRCTSISPQFRDSLLQFAARAKVSPKSLFFQTKSRRGANGGIGDRLKGITVSFLLALLTGRAFGIDSTAPVEFSQLYQPAFYAWSNQLPIGSRQHIDKIDDMDPIAGLDMIKDFQSVDVLLLSTNINFFDRLWEHPELQPVMLSKGMRPDLHVDRYFACVFQFLFAPAPRVAALVAETLARVPATHHLLCAQLRIGGKQANFRDSENFGSVANTVELASRTLHDDLSRLGVDPSNSSVFVTTDSAEALTEFQSKIGDRLLFIPGDPMHLDRSDPAVAAEGAFKMAADHYLLGSCEAVVISQSGFGATAMWRTQYPYSSVHMLIDKCRSGSGRACDESLPARVEPYRHDAPNLQL